MEYFWSKIFAEGNSTKWNIEILDNYSEIVGAIIILIGIMVATIATVMFWSFWFWEDEQYTEFVHINDKILSQVKRKQISNIGAISEEVNQIIQKRKGVKLHRNDDASAAGLHLHKD